MSEPDMERVSDLPISRLEDGLEDLRGAPADAGKLRLIARRPAIDERELLERGDLSAEVGLVGDNWSLKPPSTTDDGAPNPKAQLTIMGARAAALISDSADHADWAWAGDQLYVDLDLSKENLPAGTRLGIGDAVVEVTAEPHLGCGKFSRRFGIDALKFVNSATGRELRIRGVNARVIEPGEISVGDAVKKLS